MSNLINMRVDVKIRDQIDRILLENDSGLTKIRNDIESIKNLHKKSESDIVSLSKIMNEISQKQMVSLEKATSFEKDLTTKYQSLTQ